MIIVDCPLCDGQAPFQPETGTLECEACAVRLELAPHEPRLSLRGKPRRRAGATHRRAA